MINRLYREDIFRRSFQNMYEIVPYTYKKFKYFLMYPKYCRIDLFKNKAKELMSTYGFEF